MRAGLVFGSNSRISILISWHFVATNESAAFAPHHYVRVNSTESNTHDFVHTQMQRNWFLRGGIRTWYTDIHRILSPPYSPTHLRALQKKNDLCDISRKLVQRTKHVIRVFTQSIILVRRRAQREQLPVRLVVVLYIYINTLVPGAAKSNWPPPQQQHSMMAGAIDRLAAIVCRASVRCDGINARATHI